jgi:hypothetical protein
MVLPLSTEHTKYLAYMESDATYWTQFVLCTARKASSEARLFVLGLDPGEQMQCMLLLESISPTRMIEIIGGASNVASGDLDNFQNVKPLLIQGMEIVSNMDKDRYFGDKNVRSVSLMWLNDYMAIMYDLIQRYYAVISCTDISCLKSLWQYFPIIVYWEFATDTSVYGKQIHTPPNHFNTSIGNANKSPVCKSISPVQSSMLGKRGRTHSPIE